jgi:drug/metabolite transporter (DMT)-like permease
MNWVFLILISLLSSLAMVTLKSGASLLSRKKATSSKPLRKILFLILGLIIISGLFIGYPFWSKEMDNLLPHLLPCLLIFNLLFSKILLKEPFSNTKITAYLLILLGCWLILLPENIFFY